MTTSSSTNFSVTRDDIIKGALRLVGAISIGDSPTTDQTTEAATALNMLAKALQAEGMPLWAMKEYSLTLTSSATYILGLGQTTNIDKPLKIVQAFIHDSTTNVDVPMRIITRDEYNRLGNKTSTGTPIQLYYDVQREYGTIKLFPVPDSNSVANKTIKIVYQRPFEDFDASTDNPDFPQEWFDTLKYGLATRLSGEYGITIEDRRQLQQEYILIKQEALSFGTEEGSFSISPRYQ